MSTVVIVILGALASALLLDGIATMLSTRHFERRQRFFRMTVKAPAHVDEKKYTLINRVIAGLCSIAAGCVVLFWISQYRTVSQLSPVISYVCEDGTSFSTQLTSDDQLQVSVDGRLVRTAQRDNSFSDKATIYSDGHYAYTYVPGYEATETQVIVTQMGQDGPRSTICHLPSDINNAGRIDLSMQQRIMQTIKDADAERDYEVKTLGNDYFVVHNSVMDNGQELTGYFKDGQVHKFSYSIGLSYGLHKYLYYFDKGNLVYVYEEEADFPISNEGHKDYTKTEFAFGAGYFFIDGKLSMTNSKGTRRFTDDKVQDFEAMAKIYLDMLAGK